MRKGLSLVEMLLVVALISVLAVLAVTQQGLFLTKSKDQVISAKLMRAINAARSEASIMGMTVSLCQSKDHETCSGEWADGQIVFLDPQANGQVINKEHVLYVFDAHTDEGVLHWGSELQKPFIAFNANGIGENETGLFWYCPHHASSPKWAISVSSTGWATMIYPGHDDGKLSAIRC